MTDSDKNVTRARLYLDHAATTPVRSAARAAAMPWLTDAVAANPSSVHRSGQRARAAVERAREQLARAVGALPAEVVFTSGATEALSLALHGTLEASPLDAALVVGAGEHAAVLQAAAREARRGRPVLQVPPGPTGAVTVAGLRQVLEDHDGPVALVAAMHTNNETGGVADVAALAAVAHKHGAAFLCDAVQALGYAPLNARAWGVDLMALSAHKIGGLQGAGALIVRDGHDLRPQTPGGAQERGRRGGTHAVASICAFGAAIAAAEAERPSAAAEVAGFRDLLAARLTAEPGVHRNAAHGPVGPKHLNVRFEGVDGESLRIALDDAGIEISAGSACAAGSVEASHVLTAVGLPPDVARASVRFSLAACEGPLRPTAELIEEAAERTLTVVRRLRALPELAGPL